MEEMHASVTAWVQVSNKARGHTVLNVDFRERMPKKSVCLRAPEEGEVTT